MTYKDILYSHGNGVATIAINRPARLNAMTAETMREIGHALDVASKQQGVGVVVLTGVGDKAFSSGGDVQWEGEAGIDDFDWRVGRQIADCPKPVIARVSGYAIGGGNHMAYICDLTIAADHSIFGQNGPRVGSPAGGYFVAHLADVIGHKRAREMWMLCRRYTAQALEWGLINSVVSKERLDEEVRKWCDELLALSPTVLRIVKASFRDHMKHYMDRNVADMVRQYAPRYFDTGEPKEGVNAFLEKRKPDFSAWR